MELVIEFAIRYFIVWGIFSSIFIAIILTECLINLIWWLALQIRAMYRTEKVWREALKLYIEKHTGMKLERKDLKDE